MKICYLCGKRKVEWLSDFSFEEYGYKGEGIVHNYVCHNCGSEIEVREVDHETETNMGCSVD